MMSIFNEYYECKAHSHIMEVAVFKLLKYCKVQFPKCIEYSFLMVSETMHIVIHKIVSLPFMQWNVKPTVLYQNYS